MLVYFPPHRDRGFMLGIGFMMDNDYESVNVGEEYRFRKIENKGI